MRRATVEEANRLLLRDFGEGDLSELLAEPLHVCLIEDDSAAIFAWRGPGTYELHLMLAKRGRDAIELLSRMLETMRSEYGARSFWALIPEESRKVRLFARWMGWKSNGLLTTRTGPNELFTLEAIDHRIGEPRGAVITMVSE